MYDRHLDAFVAVAELGSFAKAGKELCLSAPAVIKQVNCLERDLQLILFDRGPRGARLTAAGEIVYRGALKIRKESHGILQATRSLGHAMQKKTIRLASSAMRSVEAISLWWSEIERDIPDMTLEIVPVVDSPKSEPSLYRRIGKDIDVFVAIKPLEQTLKALRCEARQILTSPACVAVPLTHRFAARSSVSLVDLNGERLYLTMRGYTEQIERLRDDLERLAPDIDVVDCRPYETEIFNRAVSENALVLHCIELGRVHPCCVNVPLEEPYDFPICLIYSQDTDATVRRFVQTASVKSTQLQATPAPPDTLG